MVKEVTIKTIYGAFNETLTVKEDLNVTYIADYGEIKPKKFSCTISASDNSNLFSDLVKVVEDIFKNGSEKVIADGPITKFTLLDEDKQITKVFYIPVQDFPELRKLLKIVRNECKAMVKEMFRC